MEQNFPLRYAGGELFSVIRLSWTTINQTEEFLNRQCFATNYKTNGEMRKCCSYTFDPQLIYLLQEHSFIITFIRNIEFKRHVTILLSEL